MSIFGIGLGESSLRKLASYFVPLNKFLTYILI